MMIKIENVSKSYNKIEVIQDLNLSLPSKGLFFILGESGSGKSTLFNLIAGFDFQDQGSITVGSLVVNKLKNKQLSAYHHSVCGVVLQDSLFIPYLTVIENIKLVSGVNFKIINSFIKIMHDFKLDNKINNYPYQLSGGEAQRISLARTLAFDYPIILADEPTGSLDSTSGDFIIKELTKYSKNNLVVIITHNQFLAIKKGVTLRINNIKDNNRLIGLETKTLELIPKKFNPKMLLKISFSSIISRFNLIITSILTLSFLLSVLLLVLTVSNNIDSFIKSQTINRLDSNYLIIQSYLNNNLVQLDDGIKENLDQSSVISFDLEPIINSIFKETLIGSNENFEVKIVDSIETIAVNNLFYDQHKSYLIKLKGEARVPLRLLETYFELAKINLELNYNNVVEEIELYNTPKVYVNQEFILDKLSKINLPLIASRLNREQLDLGLYLKDYSSNLNYYSTRISFTTYDKRVFNYNKLLESSKNFRFFQIVDKSDYNLIIANDEMLLKTFKDLFDSIVLIINIIIGSLSFSVATVMGLIISYNFKKKSKELVLLKLFGSNNLETLFLLSVEVGFVLIASSFIIFLVHICLVILFETVFVKYLASSFEPQYISWSSLITVIIVSLFILITSLIEPFFKIKNLRIAELIKND